MPIIYIRHGHDEYRDVTHAHDNRLTNRGLREASNLGKKLIERYGSPHIVYCSPFQRTIKTMKAMTEGSFKTLIDPNLSRYFTSKERKDPQVSSRTIKYGVPLNEDWKKFKERVKNHLGKTSSYVNNSEVVWVITHTLILKEAAKYHKVDIPSDLDFLEWFKVGKKHSHKHRHK
jgi:broad specificity phosphatase PhoE